VHKKMNEKLIVNNPQEILKISNLSPLINPILRSKTSNREKAELIEAVCGNLQLFNGVANKPSEIYKMAKVTVQIGDLTKQIMNMEGTDEQKAEFMKFIFGDLQKQIDKNAEIDEQIRPILAEEFRKQFYALPEIAARMNLFEVAKLDTEFKTLTANIKEHLSPEFISSRQDRLVTMKTRKLLTEAVESDKVKKIFKVSPDDPEALKAITETMLTEARQRNADLKRKLGELLPNQFVYANLSMSDKHLVNFLREAIKIEK